MAWKILFALALCSAQVAVAQEAKTYYYHKSTPFSIETGYRKTTGISGALFGHVSPADEDKVKRAGQQSLLGDLIARGIDPASVRLLPPTLSGEIAAADKLTRSSQRLFGGTRTDDYVKFAGHGQVGVAFVSDRKLDLPGFQRQEVAAAKLVVSAGRRNRPLGAVSDVPVGQLRLLGSGPQAGLELSLKGAVPAGQIHRLGDAVRNTLKQEKMPRKRLDTMRLAAHLEFRMKDGSSQQVRLSQARTALPGAGRFFSPSYLLHRASNLVHRPSSGPGRY